VRWPCVEPGLTLRVVLDTCILKLATLPTAVNPAALIVELAIAGRLELWASPAMLEEYAEVLREHRGFLERVLQRLELCYPLTELAIIRHKPDNRFLECALAVEADYLLTVNTARGHFDQRDYQGVRVATPGEFLAQPTVVTLVAEWMVERNK
jgi:predicted nucleic acid-binding protein